MAERKASGGKKKKSRKKKLHEKPGQARIVKLGEKKVKLIKGRGKTQKIVSLSQNVVNVIDNGKAKKAVIKNVVETPANRFLARQKIGRAHV